MNTRGSGSPADVSVVRLCWSVLLRKPLIMFGLPIVAYGICQIVGLRLGIQPPGDPIVIDHQQVSAGVGGPGPWILWLVVVGLATALIVGVQLVAAGRVTSGDAQLLSGQTWPSALRAAGMFGVLMACFSPLILAIVSTPAYWLIIRTTYSGSDVEDMRPVGLIGAMFFTAIGLVGAPLVGMLCALSVPASVFEKINQAKSFSRAFKLFGYAKVFASFAIPGAAMILLASGMIFLSRYIDASFSVKFGIGVWLFLVLVEPVHVALAVVLYGKARRKEQEYDNQYRPVRYQ